MQSFFASSETDRCTYFIFPMLMSSPDNRVSQTKTGLCRRRGSIRTTVPHQLCLWWPNLTGKSFREAKGEHT
jgi:hypothetical protein